MYRPGQGQNAAYWAEQKLRIGFYILLSCLLITGGIFLNLRAAQAEWTQPLEIKGWGKPYTDSNDFEYVRESEVYIGLGDANTNVPVPPYPPVFTVYMQLQEDASGEFLYKEFKPSTGDVQIWLLNVLVDADVAPTVNGYPSLSWSSIDVEGILELRQGKTGDLWNRPPLVQSMSLTGEYQTKAADGTIISVPQIYPNGDLVSMWYTIAYYPAASGCTTSPWTLQTGWANYMLVSGTAYDRGDVAAEGDWIGAFGPGGATDCRGIGVIEAGGFYSLIIGSNTGGETITFQLKRCSSGQFVDAQEETVFASNASMALDLNLEAFIVQEIELEVGWNLISFQVNKCFYQSTVPTVFLLDGIVKEKVGSLTAWFNNDDTSPIRDASDPNKAGDWNFIYSSYDGDIVVLNRYAAFPGLNTLKHFSAGYGYWIYMDKPGVLVLEGPPIPVNTSLVLTKEWNLIGYIPHDTCYGEPSNQSAMCPYRTGVMKYKPEENIGYCDVYSLPTSVLASICGKFLVLSSFDSLCNGSMVFYPEGMPGLNTLRFMGPKYGYWIYIDDDNGATLTFPENCAGVQ